MQRFSEPALMSKSSSTPALSKLGAWDKLGSNPPKLDGYARQKGMTFMPGGHSQPVDMFKAKSATDVHDKARTLAQMLKKPGWRLDATERPITPTMVEDVVPQNMRGPRNQPAWLKHNNQVLRFYAFYQETVTERPDENSRFRCLAIMYYMEDGTLQISEPRIENSGIPQGIFLKRHRVPRADGNGFIGPDDLRCGDDIHLYGRTYHITGCDRFTRWFYEENGVDVGEDEPMVQDLWQKSYRFTKTAEKGGLPLSRSCVEAKQMTKYMTGAPPPSKINQFILNDRKVLRFKGYWDDHTLYGARIYVVIHFFLSDNTIEINEAHARNSGRDGYPMFLKRGILHKNPQCQPVLGMLEPDKVPYMPEDLRLGESMNVWGREVVLYDCDEFTTNFYKDYMDIDQIEGKIDVSERPIRHVKLPPPPHNGIGTEEDSLINCEMVQPKPPKQDLVRLMTLSGEVLRFETKMVNGEPEDTMRRFVISYFPADHTVMVSETKQRNSGHMAGRFAKKEKKKNPDTGKFFKMTDFYVGALLTFASQPMEIIRADEHCLQYLEANCHEYPKADAWRIAHKLLPIADALRNPDGIQPDELKEIALSNGIDICDHEIITMLRRFPVSEADPVINGLEILKAVGKE